jgi:hypothetical protein
MITMSDKSIFLQAWDEIIEDSEVAQECYLSLYENVPYYGGPEEGGWWGYLQILQKYCKCSSHKQAEMLSDKLRKHCEELTEDAKKADGEDCLRHMERADRRGEDVSDDGYEGPSTYFMQIESIPGQNQNTTRSHYE